MKLNPKKGILTVMYRHNFALFGSSINNELLRHGLWAQNE
jgi:hypothetical protein